MIRKELKIKRKFYVSSRDVRIVCPRLEGPYEVHGYGELRDSAVAVFPACLCCAVCSAELSTVAAMGCGYL